MNVKNLLQRFKRYYQTSAENRTGVNLFLGFFIIPLVGMSLLFFIMYHLYL